MKGKKGALFTVLAILLSSIMIVGMFYLVESPLDKDVDSIRLRIKTTNNYIDQTEQFVKNALFITGSEAIDFMLNEMISRNSYFSNFDAEFQNCVFNGEINPPGGGAAIGCPGTTNINSYTEDIARLAEEYLNIDSTITVDSIWLAQSDPWHIEVWGNVSIHADDSYASWTVNRTIREKILIIGMEDPVYVLSTYIPYRNYINITAFEVEWEERPSTLDRIVTERHYFSYRSGPSYLNRLRNSTDASDCCGIVSIIPPNETIIPTDNQVSHLDFIYARQETCFLGPYATFDFSGVPIGSGYGVIREYGIDGAIVPYNPSGDMVRSIPHITNMTDTVYLTNAGVCS